MKALLGVLLTMAVPWTARSEIVETIKSIAITNYTGLVIDSDAANSQSGYDRDGIGVEASMHFAATTSTSQTNQYHLVFRLLDSGGQAHPVYDENGQSNTTYTVAERVVLPWFRFFNGSLVLVSTSDRTNGVHLKPAARLKPHERYSVELRIYRNNPLLPGRFQFTGSATNDTARSYYHFTNTVSSDAAANVIATLNSASFSRTYLVNTMPGREAAEVNTEVSLRRYDNFNSAIITNEVAVYLDYFLRESGTGTLIPLVTNRARLTIPTPTYFYSLYLGLPKAPAVASAIYPLKVQPAPNIQLDPVNKTYQLEVSVSHLETANGLPVAGNTRILAAQRLLHFNGSLSFGDIQTTFRSIANTPLVEGLSASNCIRTHLAVNNQRGIIDSDSAYQIVTHTYGDGTPLAVRLAPDGSASLEAGSVALLATRNPDRSTVARIRFDRATAVILDTSGARSDIRAILPAGFGYRQNLSSRILSSTFLFPQVSLNQKLAPKTNPVINQIIYACEETKPVWIRADSVEWNVAQGEFHLSPSGSPQYVRGKELELLQAQTNLVESDMAFKRSNEQYYRFVDGISGSEAIIRSDARGQATMDVVIGFQKGEFRSHFPYDGRVQWNGSGQMVVENDLVRPEKSWLLDPQPLTLQYNRDCAEMGCSGGEAGPEALSLVPEKEGLYFTPDGGLIGNGLLADPPRLEWGYIPSIQRFAQTTQAFEEGRFHISGCFLRGDQSSQAMEHHPAILILSGVSPLDLSQVERYGQPAYQLGLGDYAGLNFRVGNDGDKEAESYLAGQPSGTYPLTGRSKYYVRRGGVSGIHEAVFGSFPKTAELYGYKVTFTNYGLSYLDSQNHDSRTLGAVYVPSPSDFQQEFEELKFSCLGALESATVPSTSQDKRLKYWMADFTTHAIDFRRNMADQCNPQKGFLVLGVEAYASHVTQPLHGFLGFHPGGNLITRASGLLDDVDSRLKLPNVIQIKGPGSTRYTFMPVSDAYYNNYNFHKEAAAVGFINLAGALDVPFFQDLQVHLHTSAQRNNASAPIQMMGGWPNFGWTLSGSDFFSASFFDPDNKGFPAGSVSLNQYERSPTAQYHPRARQTWLNVVQFDYPLNWSTSTRTFNSFEPVQEELLVLNASHELKYLSPEHAEIAFGVQYDGLPQVNLANLAFNAVNEVTGISDAFNQAGAGAMRTALEQGLQQLDILLKDQMLEFFDPVLDQLADPVIHQLFLKLAAEYPNTPAANWPVIAQQIVEGFMLGTGPMAVANNVRDKLSDVVGDSPAQPGVLRRLDQSLAQVETALQQFQLLIQKTNGRRPIVENLVRQLMGELAGPLAGSVSDELLAGLIQRVDPSLDEISANLARLQGELTAIRQNLNTNIKAELLAIATQAEVADFNTLTSQASQDIIQHLNSLHPVGPLFEEHPQAEMEALIRRKTEDRLMATVFAAAVQRAVKERFYDLDAELRETIDSAFQQVNRVIRDIVSQSLASLDTRFDPFLDGLSGVMGAGQVNGYAHIKGDALNELRLDGRFQWKVPEEMEFNAFLRIKELDSTGSSGCQYQGGSAVEVTVGATDADLSWISPNLRATVSGKFSFAENTYRPLGMAGQLQLSEGLKFEAFEISSLSAGLGFGEFENYLTGNVELRFESYRLAGGVFFGRTCSLDPIALWDPQVASVLGTPPFTGAYVYGEGWMPIFGNGCVFNISAGVGAGAFYFLEGPTYGGKMMAGISGEALCLVSIHGEVSLVGVKQGDDFRFHGKGKLKGKAGSCPFCVKFKKTVSLSYENGDWDVDY